MRYLFIVNHSGKTISVEQITARGRVTQIEYFEVQSLRAIYRLMLLLKRRYKPFRTRIEGVPYAN